MKVLSAPPQNEWSQETTCQTCQARLLVELGDLKRVSGFDQRDDNSWDFVTWVCPVCKRTSQSAPMLKSIPVHLRDKII